MGRTADIHRPMSVSPPEPRKRFYDLWRDIVDTPFPEKLDERRLCGLTQFGFEILEAGGFIEKTPSHLEPNTRMFRIDEPVRRALIIWYEASPTLNTADPYNVNLLADGTHSAVVADLKAAFYRSRSRHTGSSSGTPTLSTNSPDRRWVPDNRLNCARFTYNA